MIDEREGGAGHGLHPVPRRRSPDLLGRVPISVEDLFWSAHTDLPRAAPGSDATTRLLLGLAGPLPARPRIVDVGCGTGRPRCCWPARPEGR